MPFKTRHVTTIIVIRFIFVISDISLLNQLLDVILHLWSVLILIDKYALNFSVTNMCVEMHAYSCLSRLFQTTYIMSSHSRQRASFNLEKLWFYNHTECECQDKMEDMMPRDSDQEYRRTDSRSSEQRLVLCRNCCTQSVHVFGPCPGNTNNVR